MIGRVLYCLSFLCIFYADFMLFSKVHKGIGLQLGWFLRPDTNFQMFFVGFVSVPFIGYLVLLEVFRGFRVVSGKRLGSLSEFLTGSFVVVVFSLLSIEKDRADWNKVLTICIIFSVSQLACIVGQLLLAKLNFPAILYPGQIFSITSSLYLLYYTWRTLLT